MAIQPFQTLDSRGARSARYLWEEMGGDDTSDPILIGERPDGSVHVIGTFDGATLTIQGSNDGVNWETLDDEKGDPLSFAVNGLRMFIQRAWNMRVITSGGGASTDIDIYVLLGS